jgi:hypothetical protein
MKLECIITLANAPVRLRFLAMERSLRATGSDLPLRVIPYDERRFDLPTGAEWWELPRVTAWLATHRAHPMMRKYQCLTVGGYQYVDSDVCFLRDPAKVLAPVSGFVTSCGHWHNPDETVTAASRARFATASTTWQRNVFNAGQFACDRPLHTPETLIRQAEAPGFADTCLHLPYHDQPGLNLLVHASSVPVHNLTLPPGRMQSTWAGDYRRDYRHYWPTEDEKPYLIHWAGLGDGVGGPIDALFLDHLTTAERTEWGQHVRARAARRRNSPWSAWLHRARRVARALKD